MVPTNLANGQTIGTAALTEAQRKQVERDVIARLKLDSEAEAVLRKAWYWTASDTAEIEWDGIRYYAERLDDGYETFAEHLWPE